MLLASAGVTVKLSGVNNVDIEFVSPRYVVDVDAVLLQPATIAIASARIAITVEIESVFILSMHFESGSLSVITSVITGHERKTNHFTPARMSAPRASHCYPANLCVLTCFVITLQAWDSVTSGNSTSDYNGLIAKFPGIIKRTINFCKKIMA